MPAIKHNAKPEVAIRPREHRCGSHPVKFLNMDPSILLFRGIDISPTYKAESSRSNRPGRPPGKNVRAVTQARQTKFLKTRKLFCRKGLVAPVTKWDKPSRYFLFGSGSRISGFF